MRGFRPSQKVNEGLLKIYPLTKKKAPAKTAASPVSVVVCTTQLFFWYKTFLHPFGPFIHEKKKQNIPKTEKICRFTAADCKKRGWRSVVGLQGHGLICTLGQSMPATDHQRLVACCTPCHGRMTAPCVEDMSFHPACRQMVASCTGWVNSLPETLKRRIKRHDKLPLLMGTSNDSPQPLLLTTIVNAVEQL